MLGPSHRNREVEAPKDALKQTSLPIEGQQYSVPRMVYSVLPDGGS